MVEDHKGIMIEGGINKTGISTHVFYGCGELVGEKELHLAWEAEYDVLMVKHFSLPSPPNL